MSCVCACDQRRRCLENRPIDLEPWIKFSTRTASCFYSRFSIHRHRRDVCYLKSSSANVYKTKNHLCIMWRFAVSINCNLVWIFLNGWFYFGDDDRCGEGGLVVKVMCWNYRVTWLNMRWWLPIVILPVKHSSVCFVWLYVHVPYLYQNLYNMNVYNNPYIFYIDYIDMYLLNDWCHNVLYVLIMIVINLKLKEQ